MILLYLLLIRAQNIIKAKAALSSQLLLPQRASLKRASYAASYLVHGVQKFKMQSIMVGNILTNIPCAPNGIYLMLNRFFDVVFGIFPENKVCNALFNTRLSSHIRKVRNSHQTNKSLKWNWLFASSQFPDAC